MKTREHEKRDSRCQEFAYATTCSLIKLERKVLEVIKGQDEQVRAITTAIYRAIQFRSIKSNILIIGKSGTGKTETIKQIARNLRLPYTIEDITSYTQEGYYGGDVKDMIQHLISNAGGNIAAAQRGILVIDEIDKKRSKGSSERDVAGVEVLNSLLKIIEGTTITFRHKEFYTGNLIVIFLGAFQGLDEIRKIRLEKKQIGFGFKSNNTEKQDDLRKLERGFLKKDLVDYGMTNEFVGRINTIVEMNDLTKETISDILRTSKLSIFNKYMNEFRNLGITIEYSNSIFNEIGQKVIELETGGARELNNIVNYVFERIVYDVLSNPDKYSYCQLSQGITNDNSRYYLV